jgi:hypothetical protein
MQNNGVVQTVNDNANLINAVAVANSQIVEDYEGGYQSSYPSTSEATSIGLPSTSYGGATGYVSVLLVAFKNSSLMKTLETARHNNEIALLPANSQTMWFNFEGQANSPWALYPNGLYSTPYQSYNAICAYNGGSC